MSIAQTSTLNTMGVRTLRGTPPLSLQPRRAPGGYIVLGGQRLGASQEIISVLQQLGYAQDTIDSLVQLGATDDQLLAVANGSMKDYQLMALLTGGTLPNESPVTSAPSQADLQVQVNSITQQLQAMNADLNAASQALAQKAQAEGAQPASLVQAIQQQRTDYESIVSKYTDVYRAVFGTTPPGLSGGRGLGLDPGTALAIAAAIAIIFGLIEVWWQHEQNIKAQLQVQQTQAATQQQVAASATQQAASLNAQAATAQAQGNSALAAQLRAQAQQLLNQAASTAGTGASGTTQQVLNFLSQNWIWFAVAGGALIVLPAILPSGRRRR